MKKIVKATLLAAALTALLCVCAMAETVTGSGFYGIGSASGVTITPQDAAGAKVSGVKAEVDSAKADYELFYPGSVKLEVTLSRTFADGENYVVLLVEGTKAPTASDAIYYINQNTTTAGSIITFDVYPMDIGAKKDMTLYITSDNTAFTTIAIPISYAPTGDYEAAPYTPGDVNEDGSVDVKDVTAVLNHIVGNTVLEGNRFSAADVVTDGTIDVKDATKILNKIVGNIDSLS